MKDLKLCITPFCKNKKRKRYKICSTCAKKFWRLKFPMKAAFQTLRQNSRRRKIFFDLTFEQFKKFCFKYDYLAGKGRSKDSYSIDRNIDGKLPGYTYSNLKMLTVSQNSSKEQKRRKLLLYDYRSGQAKVI